MNIGQAAQQSGLSTKTLRYYESIGLIRSNRASNGYRDYSAAQLSELRFIASARQTGFTLDECKQLLDLFRDNRRHSKQVKHFVLEKLSHVEEQIAQLQTMRTSLQGLAASCNGDEGAECGIIDTLSR